MRMMCASALWVQSWALQDRAIVTTRRTRITCTRRCAKQAFVSRLPSVRQLNISARNAKPDSGLESRREAHHHCIRWKGV